MGILYFSKSIEGSSHYLGDKQDFNVSSKRPSSGISDFLCLYTSNICSNRRNLVYRLGETILRYICCYLSATYTGHGLNFVF